ncbi:MAG: Xaa-Pro peptidase family protein [Gemmatimonadetes bacterium]|nr:Xaa-Pro peptidase family protein [Gemmatimonadota bacterium]
MSTSEARLMIAASETDADMYYATHFLAPDPFIFFQIGAEKHLLMSDLERDRARAQAQVDHVLSLSEYQEKAKKKNEEPSQIDALHEVLQEKNITHLNVPRAFAIATADDLRERGYEVAFPEGAYWPDREIKTPEEIEYIREAQQHTEAAMDAAITLIRNSEIRGDTLCHNGEPLTSEAVKREIKFLLLERDYTAGHTIVAGGDQACDPHNEGSGPLPAHQAIIIDIFPRSNTTGYFADLTRTVVKGEPSADLQNIYDAVLAGQNLVLASVRADADGQAIHRALTELFENRNFETGNIDGRMQGFFHGTGHGLGLEIHEPPRIGKTPETLCAGHIVTIEPGLYYPGRGAVRIEDLAVVTEDGLENLTTYPKFLTL